MALIPQEKPKQIALVVGIVALAALYGVYAYVYSPRVLEVTQLQTRLTELKERNVQARILSTRGASTAELEERLDAYRSHLDRLEDLIPASEEVAALLNAVTTETRRTGVSLVEITPAAPEPGPQYTRQTFDLTVVGEYHDLGRFMSSIASLSRIVKPFQVDIQPEPQERAGMESPVRAQFQIETYVLPEPGAVFPDSAATAGAR